MEGFVRLSEIRILPLGQIICNDSFPLSAQGAMALKLSDPQFPPSSGQSTKSAIAHTFKWFPRPEGPRGIIHSMLFRYVTQKCHTLGCFTFALISYPVDKTFSNFTWRLFGIRSISDYIILVDKQSSSWKIAYNLGISYLACFIIENASNAE